MDILYRLFYTVFAMSCMAAVLLPLVLFIRAGFRRLSGGFSQWLWCIVYLRAICPVGLSSPVCLIGSWNRRFHILLRSIGLTITPDRGILTGWQSVFRGEVAATRAYAACTLFWLAGAVGIYGYHLAQGWKDSRRRRDAVLLFDHVYLQEGLEEPLTTGFFRVKTYLPQGVTALEMKQLLQEQQGRYRRRSTWCREIFYLINCIHWFNPVLWLAYHFSEKDGKKVGEVEGVALWKKAGAAFVVTLLFFYSFGTSALYSTWNEGAWKQTENVSEEPLFDVEQEKGMTNEVIASCQTKTVDGLDVTIELIMTQGIWQRERGYQGQCALQMTDENGSVLATLNLSQIFSGERIQKFAPNTTLSLADYNEDGVNELSIGQPMTVKASELAAPASGQAVSAQKKRTKESESAATVSGQGVSAKKNRTGEEEERSVYGYYLLNLQDDAFSVISDIIYMTDVLDMQGGSMVFSYVEGAAGVIYTRIDQALAYYVWDKKEEKYIRKNLTEEELQTLTMGEDIIAVGEKHSFTLTDSRERVVVRVDTETDSTGSEDIGVISINPSGVAQQGTKDAEGTKTYDNIQGYYCDLQWAQTDGEKDRYAVLIYNGTKGRTFILYDVQAKEQLYQQEDGNQTLQKLFEKYNGDEITFDDDGAVIYSLMEISGDDTLKINFAAYAKGEVRVKGSYLYRLSTGQATKLQFTQEINGNDVQ